MSLLASSRDKLDPRHVESSAGASRSRCGGAARSPPAPSRFGHRPNGLPKGRCCGGRTVGTMIDASCGALFTFLPDSPAGRFRDRPETDDGLPWRLAGSDELTCELGRPFGEPLRINKFANCVQLVAGVSGDDSGAAATICNKLQVTSGSEVSKNGLASCCEALTIINQVGSHGTGAAVESGPRLARVPATRPHLARRPAGKPTASSTIHGPLLSLAVQIFQNLARGSPVRLGWLGPFALLLIVQTIATRLPGAHCSQLAERAPSGARPTLEELYELESEEEPASSIRPVPASPPLPETRTDPEGAAEHYRWPFIGLVSFMFVGATGNILVCMAVWRERRLQTATNYFLLSLAVADLLVCTLVMPFGIIYEFYGRWPYDWRICNLWVTCDVLTCSSSILHMCFISVGRYLGIRNPLHARQASMFVSRRAVLCRIALAWFCSALIASPITMMSLQDHKNIMPKPGECAIANKHFLMFGSLLAFFIPMFVMVPSYVMTVRLLSRRAKFVRNNSLSLTTNQGDSQDKLARPSQLESRDGSDADKSCQVSKFIDDDRASDEAGQSAQQDIPTVRILAIEAEPKRTRFSEPSPTTITLPSGDSSLESRLAHETVTCYSPLNARQPHEPTAVEIEAPICAPQPDDKSSLPEVTLCARAQLARRGHLSSEGVEKRELAPTRACRHQERHQHRRHHHHKHSCDHHERHNHRHGHHHHHHHCHHHHKARRHLCESKNPQRPPNDANNNSEATKCTNCLATQAHLNLPSARPRQTKQAQVDDEAGSDLSSSSACCLPSSLCSTASEHPADQASDEDRALRPNRALDIDKVSAFSSIILVSSAPALPVLPASSNKPPATRNSSSGSSSASIQRRLAPAGDTKQGSSRASRQYAGSMNLHFSSADMNQEPQMIRYLGSSSQVRSEQKATKVLGVVFFTFVFCWTPFFVMNFAQAFVERNQLARWISNEMMTTFLWLGYISSTINPVIYTVFNRNFRRAFRHLITCRSSSRNLNRSLRFNSINKSFRFSQYAANRNGYNHQAHLAQHLQGNGALKNSSRRARLSHPVSDNSKSAGGETMLMLDDNQTPSGVHQS